jgi:O-antigen/teichoic acid export membrane protein
VSPPARPQDSGRTPPARPGHSPPPAEARRALRDSALVSVGGQLERALGTLTALILRWGLDPARLGVYTGLRLYLDNTNRSSLGISLGAVQEIPILRAAGRAAEARRVADVAYTTNTLTCLIYAAILILWAWLRSPSVAGDPLAVEWTWGLVAIAGLALIKRYQDFLISVLRAYQEFALTTRMAVLDSLVSAAATALGLALAGFWGLLAAVGLLLMFNILYLHAYHPLRFRWAWDGPLAWRLMRVGLPILANTAAFGAVVNLDRVVILWRLPDGARWAGLYTIALLGTNWALDVAGRIVTVMYTYFQSTLGRTGDETEVARQALRVTEAQAPLLAAGSAVAYLIGPAFLCMLMPQYTEGLDALRPLLPGMVLLGLAWPARQMLIAVGRPYRLCLATLVGLAMTTVFGILGADRAGIRGVAWGMSLGYAIVFLLTSAVALAPALGWRAWWSHQIRLAALLGWFAVGAMLATHLPIGFSRVISAALPPGGGGPGWRSAGPGTLAPTPHPNPPPSEGREEDDSPSPRGRGGDGLLHRGVRAEQVIDWGVRCLILTAWVLPPLWIWGRRYQWCGFFERRNHD